MEELLYPIAPKYSSLAHHLSKSPGEWTLQFESPPKLETVLFFLLPPCLWFANQFSQRLHY